MCGPGGVVVVAGAVVVVDGAVDVAGAVVVGAGAVAVVGAALVVGSATEKKAKCIIGFYVELCLKPINVFEVMRVVALGSFSVGILLTSANQN